MDEIFTYMDYRDYLRDHYQLNKGSHRFFSLRYIAGKTGIDASYYMKILNKKKHISDRSIPVLIEFLKLDQLQAEFFTTLVHFNKAKERQEELMYFEKLVSLRDPPAKPIDREDYKFFSSWLNIAIREELNILPFYGNVGDLASRFQPAVSKMHVRRSITLLKKLGIIQRRKNGRYEPGTPFIITDGSTSPSEVKSFQRETLNLAIGALDSIADRDRDISTITISTTRACFEAICKRLAEIRNEIMELVRKESKSEEVYQINFQAFPLTKNGEKGKGKKKGSSVNTSPPPLHDERELGGGSGTGTVNTIVP